MRPCSRSAPSQSLPEHMSALSNCGHGSVPLLIPPQRKCLSPPETARLHARAGPEIHLLRDGVRPVHESRVLLRQPARLLPYRLDLQLSVPQDRQHGAVHAAFAVDVMNIAFFRWVWGGVPLQGGVN